MPPFFKRNSRLKLAFAIIVCTAIICFLPHKSYSLLPLEIRKKIPLSWNIAEGHGSASTALKLRSNSSYQCGDESETDWISIKSNVIPAIELDRNRFLYPVLTNGPNNQLIGFRDAVYLAIRLNRTILLPFFNKHRTDDSRINTTKLIPASQRIDIDYLSRLVPVIANREIANICQKGFDDVYLTSERALHMARSGAKNLGIRLKSSGGITNVFPRDSNFDALRNINAKKISLRRLYASQGKCAIYSAPYRSVGVKENPGALRRVREKYFNNQGYLRDESINTSSISDQELYALITMSTVKPKFVPKIVDGFMAMSGLASASYMSVHWRYDPADWQKRCVKSGRRGAVSSMCDYATKARPTDVANAIGNYSKAVDSEGSMRITTVYFAAPLTIQPFIEEVKHLIGSRREIGIVTQTDLRDYLTEFADCDIIQTNFDDIFSQLEMDICSRAQVFLRSPSSSWSKVIISKRIASTSTYKYDADILSLVEEQMEKRNYSR